LVKRSVLQKIFQEMQYIRFRLNELENNFSKWNPEPMEILGSELLLLPDHLRRTFVTLAKIGESDATTVSNHTGRCRAIESNYLNQLVRMGWLNKRRASRTTYFRPVSEKIFRKNSRLTKIREME
jgi:hypothetical protein